MANPAARDSDISKLHPAIREKVRAIRDQLQAEGIPFEVFEAFRTPERQAKLQAKRPKVTWVGPWGSIHQYGLAVDFVLKLDGKWSWDDKGAEAPYWDRMHELAKEHGMTPLYNKNGELIEKPHIQLIGASASEMRNGHYPEGGDDVWAEYLIQLIDNWEGGNAPRKPTMAAERPPLNADHVPDNDGSADPSTATAIAASDAKFQRLHGFIKHWEGGFVNHPADKGGATNMGITIGTLAAWRGQEVSIEDVRNLSRAEADEIFRTRYYAVSRCSEMSERMAMVVYNCSVMSGPKRAIELVQKSFNALGMTVDGAKLVVDGILGRLTMAAIQKTDASVLASGFMDEQEAYLRTLDTFDVFGDGWLNRMAALREFVNTLPQGAGLRPRKVMKVSESNVDLDDILTIVSAVQGGDRRAALAKAAELLLQDKPGDSDELARGKDLVQLLLGVSGVTSAEAVTVTRDADGNVPLTPINAALGQTVGRAINGKKSVSGVIGLLLTAMLPKLGLSGDIVTFIASNSDVLLTLFSMLFGWGLVGKLDKAIRLVGMIGGR